MAQGFLGGHTGLEVAGLLAALWGPADLPAITLQSHLNLTPFFRPCRCGFAILEATVFQRLLVPIDFSACSLQAARHACGLTRTVGGSLILLHVLDGRIGEQAAAAQLRALGAPARHPPLIRAVPLSGADVALTILNVAQTERADLLVLGTHGRDDLGSGVLGQVAHRLILAAQVPVHLVPEKLRSAEPRSRWLMAAREG